MVSTELLRRARGFTLIEMAIVLVVIGLLLSGGLLTIAPVLERTKITDTEAKMDRIEDALVLYAIQNSCLPCPSDAPEANTAGVQQTSTPADVAGACADATACYENVNSIVPWQTLGLTRADAIDAWGTFISYRLSTSARTNDGLTEACDNLHDSTNNAGSDGFARSGTAFPQGCLNVETETVGAAVTNQAAYVLISHGPDTSGGFFSETAAARTNPHAVNVVQDENDNATCDNDGVVTECHQGNRIDLEGATYFDDIVRWKTAALLVFECGDGACGNP